MDILRKYEKAPKKQTKIKLIEERNSNRSETVLNLKNLLKSCDIFSEEFLNANQNCLHTLQDVGDHLSLSGQMSTW